MTWHLPILNRYFINSQERNTPPNYFNYNFQHQKTKINFFIKLNNEKTGNGRWKINMNSKTFPIIDIYNEIFDKFSLIMRCLLRSLFELCFRETHKNLRATCIILTKKCYWQRDWTFLNRFHRKIKPLYTSMSNLFYYTYHKITCYYLLHEIPEINLHLIIFMYWTAEPSVKCLLLCKRTDLHILFYWTIYI